MKCPERAEERAREGGLEEEVDVRGVDRDCGNQHLPRGQKQTLSFQKDTAQDCNIVLALPPMLCCRSRQWSNLSVLSFGTGKLPQTGCLSNGNSSPHGSRGGKSKIKVSAGLVPSETLRENLFHAPSWLLWFALASSASLS